MVLEAFDLFGKRLPITYNQRGFKNKSCVGGCYTILCFLIIVLVTYSKILKLIGREGDFIQSTVVESNEDFGELSLGDMKMVPYIKLVDPETG